MMSDEKAQFIVGIVLSYWLLGTRTELGVGYIKSGVVDK